LFRGSSSGVILLAASHVAERPFRNRRAGIELLLHCSYWLCTVDGIDLEDFARRARDVERSLLPRGIVFPCEGQVWEAVRDCQVGFLAWYSKATLAQQPATPLSSGPLSFSPVMLNRGEKVRILSVDDPRPLTVSFVPVRYAELQDVLVPEYIRTRLGYSHYQLTPTTARTLGIEKSADYFTDCFRLI
jgi:hypothetical protein